MNHKVYEALDLRVVNEMILHKISLCNVKSVNEKYKIFDLKRGFELSSLCHRSFQTKIAFSKYKTSYRFYRNNPLYESYILVIPSHIYILVIRYMWVASLPWKNGRRIYNDCHQQHRYPTS